MRHKGEALKTNFAESLGNIAYQVACHQRVQNIGLKTRDILSLIERLRSLLTSDAPGMTGPMPSKRKREKVR